MNRSVPEYPMLAESNKDINTKTKCKHNTRIQDKENKKSEEEAQRDK